VADGVLGLQCFFGDPQTNGAARIELALQRGGVLCFLLPAAKTVRQAAQQEHRPDHACHHVFRFQMNKACSEHRVVK
jgi:hypothetical protein